MNTTIFSGTIPALMTPCKADRSPDFDALVREGQMLIDAGMSAVVYCGSMGDWPLLTTEEDYENVVNAVMATVAEAGSIDTAVVFMGHGTEHFANATYSALSPHGGGVSSLARVSMP